MAQGVGFLLQCGPSPMHHLFRDPLRSHREFACPLADFPRNILCSGPNFIRDTVRLLAETARQPLSLVPNPLAGSLLRFERKETAQQNPDTAAHDHPHYKTTR